MINGKVLKSKALAAFRANYWRCVLVVLIASLLTCVLSAGITFAIGRNSAAMTYDLDKAELGSELFGLLGEVAERQPAIARAVAILGEILLVLIVACLLRVLVLDPLLLGCRYFFLRNSEEPARIEEIGRAFAPAWRNNVVTMFLVRLFLVLWMLLPALSFLLLLILGGTVSGFFILLAFLSLPFIGILPFIKSYSYRLAPYLQAEDPGMKARGAIKRSRQLMDGHKWSAFGFDLSFIGWYLLTLLATVILFYVNLGIGFSGGFFFAVGAVLLAALWIYPYKMAADAELYKALRDRVQTQGPDGIQPADDDIQPADTDADADADALA